MPSDAPLPEAVPRRAWVEQIMGMPISVHLRGPGIDRPGVEQAVAALFDDLRAVDAVFSTYRDDSDVSRYNRSEITLAECHPDMATVVELCDEATRRTDGAFNAHLPDAGGGATRFDPSGLVKGWAVERSARFLEALPGCDFCLNAGGDVIVGVAGPDAAPWRVGIEDPVDPSRMAAVVTLTTGAVATSGSLHRGLHIIDPRTGRPAGEVTSATVTGPALLWADVFATAAVVLGAGALEWLAGLDGYEALLLIEGQGWSATPGLAHLLHPPAGGGVLTDS